MFTFSAIEVKQFLEEYVSKHTMKLGDVVILGLAVPSVRYQSESLVSQKECRGTLIRINPCEPEVPDGHIDLPMTGLKALRQLQEIYEAL